jgi:hypothetical protein
LVLAVAEAVAVTCLEAVAATGQSAELLEAAVAVAMVEPIQALVVLAAQVSAASTLGKD